MCSRYCSTCSRPGSALASAWVHWCWLSLLPAVAGWGIASGMLASLMPAPTAQSSAPPRSPRLPTLSLYSLPGLPLLRPSMRRSGRGKIASLSVMSR